MIGDGAKSTEVKQHWSWITSTYFENLIDVVELSDCSNIDIFCCRSRRRRPSTSSSRWRRPLRRRPAVTSSSLLGVWVKQNNNFWNYFESFRNNRVLSAIVTSFSKLPPTKYTYLKHRDGRSWWVLQWGDCFLIKPLTPDVLPGNKPKNLVHPSLQNKSLGCWIS